ncbi:MAG: Cys-Gln thioester bond-forming surface protein [Bacilli bacterium]|nr:Cys-Gln thioester bond-forming surface protein [Bacilli bacterium]
MKKLIFFLIMFISLFIGINTQAKTYSFYEAETIDNVYINRYEPSTKTLYYQKARFFRETGTKEFAYCVEPQLKFNENSSYTSSELNLSGNQVKRLKEIAHFGYGYKGHTDKIWYAVTQVMLWKETEGDSNVYFTDSLNGNKINTYDHMMNEIEKLIKDNTVLPRFSSKEFYIIKGTELNIRDYSNVLNNYTNNLNLKIENNSITVKDLDTGSYTINLTRKDNNHNNPALFYINDGSQNLLKTGNLSYLNTSLKVNVLNTSIKIIKIDKDTGNSTNSGKATFKNTKFKITNKDTGLVRELVLTDSNIISLTDEQFGHYELQEIEAGTGYNLNNNVFEFTIDKDNTDQEITIENEVIKKKIILYKTYGTKKVQVKEANIEFNVFDEDNKLVKTIKTNKDGIAEITLPYGKYTIKQLTTTTGYDFIEPITIDVNDSKDQKIHLKDFKIEVPNTKSYHSNLLLFILSLLLI